MHSGPFSADCRCFLLPERSAVGNCVQTQVFQSLFANRSGPGGQELCEILFSQHFLVPFSWSKRCQPSRPKDHKHRTLSREKHLFCTENANSDENPRDGPKDVLPEAFRGHPAVGPGDGLLQLPPGEQQVRMRSRPSKLRLQSSHAQNVDVAMQRRRNLSLVLLTETSVCKIPTLFNICFLNRELCLTMTLLEVNCQPVAGTSFAATDIHSE